MSFEEMRKYIRHPLTIPIEYKVGDENFEFKDEVRNISAGGICFCSDSAIAPETILQIRIPSVDPKFAGLGRVIWCLEKNDRIEIGLEFVDENDALRAQLIEQVCYIKSYQEDIKIKEGRQMTDEEAAVEWTRKFARKFPAI
jgi:c-di-GMP-binding flagellar brake protein YcgR